MKALPVELPGVVCLEPKVFGDARGFFFESFNRRVLEPLGIPGDFVQDNHSRSARNVLRGLHYQKAPSAQGKLVRCIRGEVFDVGVDLRRSSPTHGRCVTANLSAENRLMLWLPPGFAHGFLTLSESAELVYKHTAEYAPLLARQIRWNDPRLAIPWPLGDRAPFLSPRDAQAPALDDADYD